LKRAFIPEQRRSLFKILRNDEQFDDLLEFLEGPFAEYLTHEVAPKASRNDHDETFPAATFKALGEMGFFGIPFPEEYGGLGANLAYYHAGLESLARIDAGLALAVAIHGTCCDGIRRFASETLKEKYLPALLSGEKTAAFCLTEPDYGSDAKGMTSVYTRDGSAFRIKASKYWITNGMTADVFFLLAKSPEGKISAFLVEDPGDGTLSRNGIEGKMGVRSSNTAFLAFEDFVAGPDTLVGEEGRGFNYSMEMLNGGRITIASWSTGIARAAVEDLEQYASERKLFGARLLDLDNTRREISEMSIKVFAAREVAYGTALMRHLGEDVVTDAAMAKVFATEQSVAVCQRAIQLAGGFGYVHEAGIEQHLRDALLGRIGEGANELLTCRVIADRILGRPQS